MDFKTDQKITFLFFEDFPILSLYTLYRQALTQRPRLNLVKQLTTKYFGQRALLLSV